VAAVNALSAGAAAHHRVDHHRTKSVTRVMTRFATIATQRLPNAEDH
jgi:hypothetical protein